MSRTEARAYYDKKAGDPDAGYVSPEDAKSAIDVTYRDMASGEEIADGVIGTAMIADNAVTAPKIAANAVDTAAIQNVAVTNAKIAPDAVTSTKIADNAVTASELADDAVDTASIQDAAVTAEKLAVQPGNLLTENQASIETDTTGLGVTNDAGGTAVARVTSDYYVGAASLQLTSGAAGTDAAAGTPRDAGSAYRVLVTPGETYTAHAMVKSATRSLRLRILWWTSGGAYISVAGTSGVACTAWTRLTTTGVAPATAAYCSVEVDMTTTGSGSDTAFIDALGFWKGSGGTWAMPGEPIRGLTDAPLGNLLPLNVATGTDAEGATTGFVGAGGCTLASSTTRAYQGSRSLAATATAAGPSFYTPYGTSGIPVTPGETITAQARVWVAGTGNVAVRLHWYTAAGADISSVVGNAVSGAAWNLSTVTGVAPATAAYCAWVTSGAGFTVSDVIYFDALGLWKGSGGLWAMPGEPIRGLTDAPLGNLLSLNQATGTASAAVSNATQSGAVFTATSTAAMACQYLDIPATAGEVYTATVTMSCVGRGNRPSLNFRNASSTNLGSYYGDTIAAGASGTATITAVAPAGTTTVRIYMIDGGITGAIGDTVTVSRLSVHRGAAGTFALPGVPVPGTSRIAVNNAVDLSGEVAPEGSVQAAVGSSYLQTTGAITVTGACLWRKVSGGGGAYGWTPEGALADTGWRNINTLVDTSIWTPHPTNKLAIRRKGDTVFLGGRLDSVAAWNVVNVLSTVLPAGFRNTDVRNLQFTVRSQSSSVSGPGAVLAISESGQMVISRSTSITTGNADAAGTIVWPTASYMAHASGGWPTSLPGSAA